MRNGQNAHDAVACTEIHDKTLNGELLAHMVTWHGVIYRDNRNEMNNNEAMWNNNDNSCDRRMWSDRSLVILH